MTRAVVAIGSNINPERNIRVGLRMLAELSKLRAVSPFYRTPAIGRPHDPEFWNGAALVEEADTLDDFRSQLRQIEDANGRVRSEDRYAARTLDLDLVLWGDLVAPDERIPDPHLWERSFVGQAVLHLLPDLVVPGVGKRLDELVKKEKLERVPFRWVG